MLAMTVASLLPHASLLYAQETSIDETMVVTANRFEQSINSTLAPVVVVTKEDIQSTQAKSIEEVLRRLPGIQVSVMVPDNWLVFILVAQSLIIHLY